MINSTPINSTPARSDTAASEQEAVDAIVRASPRGAIALAGTATAVVVALWLAFYALVFLSRATPP
jgi:hypothetical protein